MKAIQAQISESMYKALVERIRLGLYGDENEVVNKALQKLFAEQSRDFLRKLTKQSDISQEDMLAELKSLRS